LLSDPAHPLEEELFGPATVVVAVQNMAELLKLLPVMRGHLSTSLFATADDLADARQLIETFESRTGRLILNEFPTGVEVCEAMIHGGPWPATSDCRSTSVGTLAIDRFLRPLCYQGYPDSLLPPALQDGNPLKIRRLINGEWH
jgi:NADP-dependent aldehyde dehydrogenase